MKSKLVSVAERMTNEDEKWISALKPYWGGGIVPFWKLADGTVDAAKTVNCMMKARAQNQIGPNGEDVEIPE